MKRRSSDDPSDCKKSGRLAGEPDGRGGSDDGLPRYQAVTLPQSFRRKKRAFAWFAPVRDQNDSGFLEEQQSR